MQDIQAINPYSHVDFCKCDTRIILIASVGLTQAHDITHIYVLMIIHEHIHTTKMIMYTKINRRTNITQTQTTQTHTLHTYKHHIPLSFGSSCSIVLTSWSIHPIHM